jgi:TonB family protein
MSERGRFAFSLSAPSSARSVIFDKETSMFESVLERNVPPRQIGRAAVLAVGVHTALLVMVTYFSARRAPAVEKKMPPITIFHPTSRLAPASTAAAGERAPVTKTNTEHRAARPLRTDIDKGPKRPEPSSSTAAITGDPSPHGGDPAATQGTGVATGVDVPGDTGAGAGIMVALPFGEGMRRPIPIVQPAPSYTREASAARSEGTVSVRCIITTDGTLKDCRIAKSVPYMDGAVLEALSRWKYTPVTFQGRPVSVYYSINLRLVAP